MALLTTFFTEVDSLNKMLFLKLQDLKGRGHIWLLWGLVHQRWNHFPLPWKIVGARAAAGVHNWTTVRGTLQQLCEVGMTSPLDIENMMAVLFQEIQSRHVSYAHTPSLWPWCLDLLLEFSPWLLLYSPFLVLTPQAFFLDYSSPLQTPSALHSEPHVNSFALNSTKPYAPWRLAYFPLPPPQPLASNNKTFTRVCANNVKLLAQQLWTFIQLYRLLILSFC